MSLTTRPWSPHRLAVSSRREVAHDTGSLAPEWCRLMPGCTGPEDLLAALTKIDPALPMPKQRLASTRCLEDIQPRRTGTRYRMLDRDPQASGPPQSTRARRDHPRLSTDSGSRANSGASGGYLR